MESGLPKVVGSYRLEALIGQGGMGAVYRAHDRKLDRRVAIKHVRPDAHDPVAARARLRREARSAARLSHPAIVQVFELVENEDGDWIVLELVDGRTLAEHLREGPLPYDDVVALGLQVADGLAEAHAKGILHRDLKATNVVVTPSGRAKILDFGLAKPMIRGEDDPSISARGQVLGTGHAMSPEQARGLELTCHSDLFSLGSLLYEMSTGVSPFQGDNLLDTLARINTHTPPRVDRLRPSLPPAFADLVVRLLEKAPELRPRKARQVAEALERLAQQGSPTSQPEPLPAGTATSNADTLGPPARPPSGWRRRGAMAAGLVAAMPVVAFVWWAGHRAPSSDRPTAPQAALPAHVLYDRGMAFLRRFDQPGSLDRARETFQRMLVRQPESAPAYAGLARVHWRHYLESHGDSMLLELAAAAASQAVDLDPYLADARVSRALVAVEQGRPGVAEADLREALLLEPGLSEAHHALGQLEASRGALEAAEAAYRRAIALEPDERLYHDELGALLFRTGRYEEAEAAFERSIEIAPGSIVGYRNLASTYYLGGRLTEAAATLQRALTIQPSATLHSSLGTIFFSQGLYAKAAAAFESALDETGNHHLYWSNLADAYRQLPDRGENAREAYRRARQLLTERIAARPRDVGLLSRRVLVLAKLGEREDALDEIARIESTQEIDAYSLYRLAVAREICGQRSRAVETLARAVEAGFASAEVRRDPELLALRADPAFHRMMMARVPDE